MLYWRPSCEPFASHFLVLCRELAEEDWRRERLVHEERVGVGREQASWQEDGSTRLGRGFLPHPLCRLTPSRSEMSQHLQRNMSSVILHWMIISLSILKGCARSINCNKTENKFCTVIICSCYYLLSCAVMNRCNVLVVFPQIYLMWMFVLV